MSEIPPKDMANSMSAEDLLQLLSIAYQLQKALAHGDQETAESLAKNREKLLQLLEYMVQNLDNPNIDKSLLPMLQQMLGIDIRDVAEKLELEEEKEEKLSKEERERRNKLLAYEVYKMVNPHRLAGESALDNFISNVKLRGFKEAMKYEGKEYSKDFEKKDLENLESHQHTFVDAVTKAGSRGGGLTR